MRFLRALARLLAAITLVGCLARLAPTRLSALPLLPVIVSATPWYALTGALALALCLACRIAGGGTRGQGGKRPLRGVAVLMLVCLALEAPWQLPFYSRALTHATATHTDTQKAGSLRVMTCNVYKGNADAARIVKLVREEGVRVLALQETTSEFVDQLEANGISDLLPYSQRSSSDGVYGNGVWSATPLSDVESDDVGSSASAMPAGIVQVTSSDGVTTVPVRFVSVHTTAPVDEYLDLWRKSILEIGVVRDRAAADPSRRYVLMGDFNATYDHAPFRAMLGDSLHDAARIAGEGITLTWPQNRRLLPPFCGIDHVVVSDGVGARDLRTYEVEGTDHAALVCTLDL